MQLTEEQALALEIIQEFYQDPIDAIGQPTIDGGTISVDFQDEDRVFSATITGSEVAYYEIDSEGNRIEATDMEAADDAA
jgi:hypothetical protein